MKKLLNIFFFLLLQARLLLNVVSVSRKKIAILSSVAGYLFAAGGIAFAQTTSFNTPGAYTYTVAPGVTSVQISAAGASADGGNGGNVTCNLSVYEGEVLNLYVGGVGGGAGSYMSAGAGGYNGGGDGGTAYGSGGGGGGASDIRVGGTDLTNRIIVAGGGGGSGVYGTYYCSGGNGGGLTGSNGLNSSFVFDANYCGTGGTQTAGGDFAIYGESIYGSGATSGSLGQGGTGGQVGGWGGGGGGGGYYGGGGGGGCGGGGGSSYYGGAGVTSATTSAGANSGNGYINITVLCTVGIGTISGASSLCRSTSTNLSESVGGGTWSSGTPATASINSSGQVTGIAMGTAIISYTVTDGCGTSSATKIINIDSINAGTITGSSSICPGSTSTLSDITAYGGAGIWSSTNTASGSVDAVTGVVTAITAGTTTISYTVANSCGTVAATAVVTVNSAPTVGATGGGIAICSGNTAILSGSGATSYSWSGGIVNGVAFTPAVGVNSYTVTGTDEHSCTNTAVATVTVNALPTVGTTGSVAICSGNTATLSGTGAVSYSWSGGITDGVAFTPPVGVDNYTVTGTDGNSCTNTAVATATVNALPTVGATGGGAICSGNTVTLSGTGAVSYSWSGGITNGVAFTPSVGVSNYTVTGTDGHSCINTAVATVTVNASPDAGVISGMLSVCAGANTSVTDAATGGSWSAGSGNASINASGNVIGITAGTATIYYTVTIPGCAATASATVTVNGTPSAIAGAGAVCAGATLSLSSTSMAGAPMVFNVTGAPQVYTVPAGVYQVNVTLTGGQGGAGTATSGGNGGTTTASIAVTPGQVLNVFVGDGGTNHDGSGGTSYNGGGVMGSVYGTGAGGGASDIRTGGTDLSNRIIVAGGGGGGGFEESLNGGAGGGLIGMSGGFYPGTTAATGGTQTSGGTGEIPPSWFTYGISGNNGSLGQGGNMLAGAGGGAGGGGYYGGGSGDNFDEGGGAGGSSYADPTVTSDVVMTQGTNTSYTGMVTIIPLVTNAGVWTSSSANATVVGSTGVVTGVMAGTANISFTIADGCNSTATVTVNPLPDAGAIAGTATVCAGATTNMTDAASGGVWSSGTMGVASVSSTGVVTGVSTGTAGISYTVTNSCGATMAIKTVTVSGTPSAGTITGPSSVFIGSVITLTDAAGGGSWSASNGNATVAGGVVHGVTAGTVTISYSVTGVCGTASATKLVSVGTSTTAVTVSAISGYFFYLCTGANATFWDATMGGTWSMSPASVATVSATGIVSGISTGTATLTYTYLSTPVTAVVTVYATPATVTGANGVCVGSTTALTDVTPGGAWSSVPSTIASVSAAGTVTGVMAGTATIYYATPAAGCRAALVVTVSTAPSGIGGASSVCVGSGVSLSDFVSGGAWSSTAPASVVSTGTTTAMVTGVSAGTATITYSLGASCYKTYNVTVKAIPTPILGNRSVCGVGAVTFLSDATTGTSWTISPAGTATVSPSGRVYGVSAGMAIVTYTGTNSCITTTVVTINALLTVAPISGATNVSHGATISLSDITAGGVWSSSNPALGSVDATGDVTGVGTSGTVTISYAVAYGSGCTATATKPVTVHTPAPHSEDTTATTGANETTGVSDMAADGLVATDTRAIVGTLPFEVSLLPNPNKGAFTVKGTVGSDSDEAVTLEITNMLGQVIYTSKMTASGGVLNEQVILNNNLPNGMYLLNVSSGNEQKVFHFVMEK